MPRGDTFDQALVFVVRRLRQVNVTKLEKILYLADLEHFHRTGATLTGVKWVRFKLGPLAYRLPHSRDDLNGHEIAVSYEVQGEHEAQVYRPGPAPRFEPALAAEGERNLNRILHIAEPLSTSQMIDLAYSTTPMRFLISKEKERGGKPRYRIPIQFELDFNVVASSSAEREHQATPADRGAFKLRELARIADLQQATLVGAGRGD